MKTSNIKYLALLTFAASSLLMGCSEDVYEGAYKPSLESHYLSVYPRDFVFGNREETQTGSITSENAWSFTNVPSWLTLSPSSGNSDTDFSVTSVANETMTSKTAVFYLSTNTSEWSQQKTITASQAAQKPLFKFVDLENTSIYLNGGAQTLTIGVETNLEDIVSKTTVTSGSDGWITAAYENKKLTISVNANDDGYQRTGRVELYSMTHYSAGGTIYITQYKPNLSFNEITSLSFDADGGSQNVSVSSEISWFALSKESWIEITPSEGNAGNNQVKITALPSYQSGIRNGKALFYYKDNQSSVGSISVSQTGRFINISPTSVTLPAEENSSEKVDIDSNIGWEVSSCPSWLVLNQNKGDSGKTTITISAHKNNSLNSRSGTIILKDSKTGGIQSSITVTQNGIDFGDNTTLEFSWHQSSLSLDIPLPGNWNAAVSDGWITLSQYIGTGETTCDITVSRNDAQDARTGAIIFSTENQNITISVVQEGQYITIDATSGEIPAMGGFVELHVNTTVDVVPSIEYESRETDWIAYEKVSDNLYQLSVKYNPSINQRYATLVLNPKDSNVKDELTSGVRFNIKQFGRELRVEPSIINLFAKGGTTETYSIVADGTYSIQKPEEYVWFTLVHNSSNNTYYIVATENKTEQPRTGEIMVRLTNLPQSEESSVTIPIYQFANGDVTIIIDDFNDPIIW